MMRLKIHRVLDSQVADVPGRRRIEVLMSFREQRVVCGQVPHCPIDGGRPNVDMILEELGQGPPRSPFNLDVGDLCRQVLVGL